MKELKVEVPGVTTKRLDELDPGMQLARPATNQDGQLLMGEDSELTDENIDRLRRFDVSRVVVHSLKEKWIEAGRREDYDVQSVVDERTVEDEQSAPEGSQSLRQLRRWFQGLDRQLEDGGDIRAFVRRLYELEEQRETHLTELLSDASSPDVLKLVDRAIDEETDGRDLLDTTLEQPELNEVINWMNQCEDLRNQSIDFHRNLSENGDVPETVEPPEADLSPGGEREDLFSLLSGLLDETDDADEGVRDRLQDFLRALKLEEDELESLMQAVYDRVDDRSEHQLMLEALDGDPEAISQLREANFDDFEAPEELLNDLRAFLEDRSERHRSLERFLGDAYDGSGVEELLNRDNELDYPSPSDSVNATSNSRRSDRAGEESLEQLLTHILGQFELDGSWEGRLRGQQGAVRDLNQRRRDLAEQVQDLDEAGNLKEFLENPEAEPFPDLTPGSEAMELFNEIVEHHGRRNRLKAEIDKTLRETGLELDQAEIPRSMIRTLRERAPASVEAKSKEIPESAGTDGDGYATSGSRDDALREAIRTEDVPEVSELAGVPEQLTRSAFEFYNKPENISEQRGTILDQIRNLVFRFLFFAEPDPDGIQSLESSIAELLRNHNHPVKVLLHPPSMEELLLVHAYNNAVVTDYLARQRDLPDAVRRDLLLSVVLADVGLCAIPRSMVINRSNSTARGEFEYMKHPLYTEKILRRVEDVPEDLLALAKQHHERSQGSGFPEGLDPSDQHEYAPLVQVVDRYTALIENRPEQPELDPPEVVETLHEDAEGFSGEELGSLLKEIGYYPDGSVVLLEDGRMGIVRSQNGGAPRNPEILVFTDENKNRRSSPEALDLEDRSVGIKRYLRR